MAGIKVMRSRSGELDREDRHGPPYRPLRRMDYEAALAVARSAHPSRVLANTDGYRYGRFAETVAGTVTVTLMGSRIAEFRPEGVALSSCGWPTPSTTEALSNLVTGGWFYSRGEQIFFARYGGPRRDRKHVDGQVYPYARRKARA